jgi:hypothetical protein
MLEGLARMTDAQLRRDVIKELQWEPSVEAAHAGVVMLTGHVPVYARRVRVENRLEMAPW